MTGDVLFEVIGNVAGNGSKRGFVVGGHARMVDMGGMKAVAWRDSVSAAARDLVAEHGQFDGPLHLEVTFRSPMPASRSKAVRQRGTAWRTSAPDLDKLLRSTCDALTASGLIRDDARVSAITARKIEVVTWTGAEIALTRLTEVIS